jgi:hypothetical protein
VPVGLPAIFQEIGGAKAYEAALQITETRMAWQIE